MPLGLGVVHAGDGLEVVEGGQACGIALEHGAPEMGYPVAGGAQADQPDQPLDAGLGVVGEPLVRLQLAAAGTAGLAIRGCAQPDVHVAWELGGSIVSGPIVSSSGSEMGAAIRRQLRSDAVRRRDRGCLKRSNVQQRP